MSLLRRFGADLVVRGMSDAGTTGNFEVTLRKRVAWGRDPLDPANRVQELAFSKQRGDSPSGFPDSKLRAARSTRPLTTS